ncbi:hypothetical protein [Emticicia agri]|uniref:DUF5683 domain-containing protein n=1 Tax=Emticicia agri TaxID=2492393 RepID=A0A4Q5M3C8_9BACT|nr:hypothetical protein [Emticicia agri]RYU96792.1 hypothetical protein EWM59_04505 [Emticicia agri]
MKSFAILLILVAISIHTSAQTLDSLTTKRAFLTTKIYRNGFKLSNDRVLSLYQEASQSKAKYNWGRAMNPVGPVVFIAGIGLAAIGLKGQDATAMVRGREVNYKIRSLPQVLAGVGIAAAGLCIIESSNELIRHSVDIYNAGSKNQKPLASFIQKVNLGITESNGIGFTLRF